MLPRPGYPGSALCLNCNFVNLQFHCHVPRRQHSFVYIYTPRDDTLVHIRLLRTRRMPAINDTTTLQLRNSIHLSNKAKSWSVHGLLREPRPVLLKQQTKPRASPHRASSLSRERASLSSALLAICTVKKLRASLRSYLTRSSQRQQ